jgi:hypothetical protein
MEGMFTRDLHWSLSWARSMKSIPLHHISLRSILILWTQLRLDIPSGFFPSGFPTYILYEFLSCPSHPPWLGHCNYTWRRVRNKTSIIYFCKNTFSQIRLTAVNTKPCRLLKAGRCFAKICRLHLRGQRISDARNYREAGSKQSRLAFSGQHGGMHNEARTHRLHSCLPPNKQKRRNTARQHRRIKRTPGVATC